MKTLNSVYLVHSDRLASVELACLCRLPIHGSVGGEDNKAPQLLERWGVT